MSVSDLFEISETDTVWDAWLTTVNLLDMVEHLHGLRDIYDFADAREKIARTYSVAEFHALDKVDVSCTCGLSQAEHSLLKRKIMTFFALQVANMKHFVY